MDDVTRRRKQRNEDVFRAVNEEIDDRSGSAAPTPYVCECSDTTCTATVVLSHDEYAAVRRGDTRYFVLPGHVDPAVERVAEEHDGYVVVDKS